MRGFGTDGVKREILSFTGELSELLRAFNDWIKKNSVLMILTGVMVCMSFGALLLNSESILTDSESYIMRLGDTLDTFIKSGRFGFVFTKRLFFTNAYTPFLFTAYMMAAMFAFCIFINFFVYRICMHKSEWGGEIYCGMSDF